jgi:ATP-dependent Lon protease
MEVIEFPGYIEEERSIAHHLLPRQLEEAGLMMRTSSSRSKR